MSVIVPHEKNGYIHFDEAQSKAAGEALADQYRNAQPFPHIVMDDFLPPDFLRGLLGEFPDSDGKDYFDRAQERLKFQYRPREISGPRLRNLVMELNSPPVLKFLEALTGTAALIADPYFDGAGLHEIKRGGHVGIHADFNIHQGLQVERRLNLIIYLNDDWHPEYGGALELWDQAMQGCCHRIAPVIGRAVVFSTALDSFHGHPDPLSCPPERSRRSIATFYYTARANGMAVLPSRTTVFKPRPASGDRRDRRVAFDHFLRDWVPPRLYRFAARLNRFS